MIKFRKALIAVASATDIERLEAAKVFYVALTPEQRTRAGTTQRSPS